MSYTLEQAVKAINDHTTAVAQGVQASLSEQSEGLTFGYTLNHNKHGGASFDFQRQIKQYLADNHGPAGVRAANKMKQYDNIIWFGMPGITDEQKRQILGNSGLIRPIVSKQGWPKRRFDRHEILTFNEHGHPVDAGEPVYDMVNCYMHVTDPEHPRYFEYNPEWIVRELKRIADQILVWEKIDLDWDDFTSGRAG